MASDAEVDLLINAQGALPELERDLQRIITTAQRNADDVDVNAVLQTQGAVTRITTQLNRVVAQAQANGDDVDVTAVLNQIQSLNAIRTTLDDVVTQVNSGAPDIDVNAVLNRTNSVRNIRRGLDDVIRQVQRTAPYVNLRSDTDDTNQGFRRLTDTFRRVSSAALGAASSLARVGAITGVVGGAVLSLAPLVGGLVQELNDMVPASAVGVSALLTLTLAAGTAKIALIGVGDAIGEVFDPDADPEKLAEALKRLAPEARAFVLELQKMRGPLREIQQRVQDRFFRGFDDSLRTLSRSLLPSVNTALDDTADSLNAMARGAATAAGDLADQGILGSALKSSTRSLENLERIPAQIVDALGRLAAAAGPSLERLTSALADKADEISRNLDEAFRSGALQETIEDAIESIRQLGRVGGNVLGGLRNIFNGLTQNGNFLFDRLESITSAFEELTGSDEAQEFFGALEDAVRKLGEALSPILSVVLSLAKEAFPILTTVLEFAADLFERLRPVVGAIAEVAGGILTEAFEGIASILDEVLPRFQQLADDIGPKLNEFWEKLRPLLEEAGVAFGELLVELGPIIADMLELTFILAEKLLPLVGGILIVALMAFIGVIRILREVFEFLQPVIENIVKVFRGDFSGALEGSMQLTARTADTIKRVFGEMKDRVVQTVRDLATQQVAAFRDMFFRVTTAVGDFLNRLGTAFSRIPGIVRDATGDLGGILIDAGADIVRGLIAGMQSQLGRLRDIASEIASVVSGTVKDILRISSPSREFREIGDDTIQGFIDGLRAAAPGLEATMNRIASDFLASSQSGDSVVRLEAPETPAPVVNVYVGNEALDPRLVRIADNRIYARERVTSQGVRT